MEGLLVARGGRCPVACLAVSFLIGFRKLNLVRFREEEVPPELLL
jgi:hypothetical protein